MVTYGRTRKGALNIPREVQERSPHLKAFAERDERTRWDQNMQDYNEVLSLSAITAPAEESSTYYGMAALVCQDYLENEGGIGKEQIEHYAGNDYANALYHVLETGAGRLPQDLWERRGLKSFLEHVHNRIKIKE